MQSKTSISYRQRWASGFDPNSTPLHTVRSGPRPRWILQTFALNTAVIFSVAQNEPLTWAYIINQPPTLLPCHQPPYPRPHTHLVEYMFRPLVPALLHTANRCHPDYTEHSPVCHRSPHTGYCLRPARIRLCRPHTGQAGHRWHSTRRHSSAHSHLLQA